MDVQAQEKGMRTSAKIGIRFVTNGPDVRTVRQLFLEYQSAIGTDLCFQDFTRELTDLPGEYAPPSGRLLLAVSEGDAAGCAAMRRIEEEVCELKRMYIRPKHRGKGIGRIMAEVMIGEARKLGYKRMRLDTLSTMKEAIGLYESLGFIDIPAYRYNPISGARYMELALRST